MEILRINSANKNYLDEIARIHISVLKESFLNNFGLIFLKIIYNNISKSQDTVLIVSIENKEITGYLLAVVDYSKFLKIAFSKNKMKLVSLILKSVLKKPDIILKIIPSLFKVTNEKPHAELQFIAIKPEHQGKNIGTSLVEALNNEFAKQKINTYFVGTKSSDNLSNRFYQKLGFQLSYKKKYFGDELNYYRSK